MNQDVVNLVLGIVSGKSVTVDSASRNTYLHEQVGAKGWARQDSNL